MFSVDVRPAERHENHKHRRHHARASAPSSLSKPTWLCPLPPRPAVRLCIKQRRLALAYPAICLRASKGGGGRAPCICMHKAARLVLFLCCPVLSAVLWVLSARSLGPLPFQQHQTERGLMAVGSLNSKLTVQLFVSSFPNLPCNKIWDLLVTNSRALPFAVLGANTKAPVPVPTSRIPQGTRPQAVTCFVLFCLACNSQCACGGFRYRCGDFPTRS